MGKRKIPPARAGKGRMAGAFKAAADAADEDQQALENALSVNDFTAAAAEHVRAVPPPPKVGARRADNPVRVS